MRKFSFLTIAFVSLFFFSCQKESNESSTQEEIISGANSGHGHLKQTKTFSSDVVISWLNMQLVMLKTPVPGQTSDRSQAYCGIALYESVVNGMPAYQSLYGQLKDFPAMPSTEPGKAYHWSACANAALAEMNRRLFPNTADANKNSMTLLENSLNVSYAAQVDDATLQRSIAFGKEVAQRVAVWAAGDGFANLNPTYVPPVGPGLWVPTAATAAVNPYAYQRRLMVPGVANGTELTPLPPYSTEEGSAFYKMVYEVYDVSTKLTDDQKAMADYFKDAPGYGPGGGFVSILSQAFAITEPSLDMAALTYAKVGIAQHEATIILFTNKYIFNVIRPVTYIRAVIKPGWSTYIPTPNHPEFPSGHATTNGAVLSMMSNSFGENFPMTLHTYDYLNYPSRSYNTFTEMGLDMANSRLYGGLHYRETCEKSIAQGRKVTQNILSTLQFSK
ncbi:MAG TPA: vanadium-dependent haloperoxidase [Flavitalea sp.]|nr:vanadium-dependent haloperoxidase [Flavitalea sp.]